MTEKLKNLKKFEDMVYSCGLVGDCRNAYRPSVGKYGSCPMWDHVPGFEPYFSRGKLQVCRGLLEGNIELSQEMLEVIAQCTLCGACQATCFQTYTPGFQLFVCKYIDHPRVFEALRADLVEAGFLVESHRPVLQSMRNYDNPWRQPRATRDRWARKLPKGTKIKDLSKNKAEVLYYVGCTASYDAEIQKLALNTVEIFNKLGVDFGILGPREVCCGSVALRIGDRDTFYRLKKQNLEILNNTGASTIVTSCAGCYKTLKTDYEDGIQPEILHTTEYLARLIDAGKMTFDKEIQLAATYHDPCHLGRHAQVFEAPRKVLTAIPGLTLTEMKKIKQDSRCCGAGGGVRSGFPELANALAKDRLKDAEETGADVIVSACPFCYQNIGETIKGIESKMGMKDITEVVNSVL